MKWVTSVLLVCMFAATVSGATFHVNSKGNDAAAGNEAAPLATLGRAVELAGTTEPATIVVHGGTWYGTVRLTRTESAAPLVIEAARDAAGKFVDACFDGSLRIDKAEPVKDRPGTFAIKIEGFTSNRVQPQMWEADTRVRYQYAADLRGVAGAPASFFHEEATGIVYFSTSDGKGPEAHEIGVERTGALGGGGIRVERANVTLRGLTFRHCAYVTIAADNATVEDCRVSNAPRCVIISPGCKKPHVVRCYGIDVYNGVMSHGIDTVVEDCTFLRPHDRFTLPNFTQDNSGVQFYNPALNGVARRNLTAGFNLGVFMKGVKGNFTVENNTLVGAGADRPMSYGIFRVDGWNAGDVCRNNIVSDFYEAIASSQVVHGAFIHQGNWLWRSARDAAIEATLQKLREGGATVGDHIADPRFVAEYAADYRLAPDSPADGAGAMPKIAKGDADTVAPRLALAAASPAVSVGDAWITEKSPAVVTIDAEDRHSGLAQMKVKVGDEPWSSPAAFAAQWPAELSVTSPARSIAVMVSDAAGNWSPASTIDLYLSPDGPALVGEPIVRTTVRGAAVLFDTTVPCVAELRWGNDESCPNVVATPRDIDRSYDSNSGNQLIESDVLLPRRSHSLAIVPPDSASSKSLHYRLVLRDALGQEATTPVRTTALAGEARTLHVSPAGEDASDRGSADKPWRTIQYAIDRALPGDRVVLADGIYRGRTIIHRGGLAGAPIILEAANIGQAVIETGQDPDINAVILLEQAPHITFRGLEVRWFYRWAIYAFESEGLTVERCKFWNQHFVKGRRSGVGVFAVKCKDLLIDRNLFVSMDSAFDLFRTTDYRVTHNTVVRMNHRCSSLIGAAPGVIRNNSFTFTGNYHFLISMTAEQFAQLDSDYNNFAQYVHSSYYEKESPTPEERAELLVPVDGQERLFSPGNKGLASIHGFAEETVTFFSRWQQKYGKDKHSVFAHPLYVDPLNHDFRVQASSPNVGAGEGGATIGAFEVVK